MRKSIPELKNTNNNYYKIGLHHFTYLLSLPINKLEKAVHFASIFFKLTGKYSAPLAFVLYNLSFALINAEKIR